MTVIPRPLSRKNDGASAFRLFPMQRDRLDRARRLFFSSYAPVVSMVRRVFPFRLARHFFAPVTAISRNSGRSGPKFPFLQMTCT